MESRHEQIQNSEITPEQRRALALADLFSRAAAAYASGAETITRKEFSQYLKELRASRHSSEADAYERHASSNVGSRFLVDRRRTDARLEAFIETIALETRTIFGKPFYSTIATIANVAFRERNIYVLDAYRKRLEYPDLKRAVMDRQTPTPRRIS